MKRCPQLSERKAQYISLSLVEASSPRVINEFFKIVSNEYNKIKKESGKIIEAQDVYNCDEIGFQGEKSDFVSKNIREKKLKKFPKNTWK